MGSHCGRKRQRIKGTFSGFLKNHTSKDAAQSDALTACQQHAVQKCELSYTYKNGCVAVADPINGGQKSEIKYNVSEDKAKEAAQLFCSLGNQQSCRIIYSGCSL